jgi:hypothetical protein
MNMEIETNSSRGSVIKSFLSEAIDTIRGKVLAEVCEAGRMFDGKRHWAFTHWFFSRRPGGDSLSPTLYIAEDGAEIYEETLAFAEAYWHMDYLREEVEKTGLPPAALVPCALCKTEVRRSAKRCPRCDVAYPAREDFYWMRQTCRRMWVCAGLLYGGAFGAGVVGTLAVCRHFNV